jgi:TRAP-type C4-dicarboxylate transport system permease small subunit
MGVLAWRTVAGLITVKASHEVTMIVGFPVWIGYAAIVPSLALAALAGLHTAWDSLKQALR